MKYRVRYVWWNKDECKTDEHEFDTLQEAINCRTNGAHRISQHDLEDIYIERFERVEC